VGSQGVAELGPDDPVWTGVAHALAQLCHVLACSTAPNKIAIGGGVLSRQPHLLGRIEAMLVESLAGYIQLPSDGPYVIAPGLGDRAGPLGAIALAMDFAR
jgi:fructokinase